MMNPKHLIFILLLCSCNFALGQNKTLRLNLEQVIDMAQRNAPEVNIAKARLQRSKLQYDQFQINRKPFLELNGQLPRYSRITYPVPQPDGTQKFRRNQSLSANADLSLSKVLNTGGLVYASTGLQQRIDFFPDAEGGNLTSYLSSPIHVGFTQPFFGFNGFKWDKKIQPLIVEEAEREYAEQLADIAQTSVGHFFSLYIAQLELEDAKMDKQNADELYTLSQGRYKVGKIAETDLLQMELGVMNAETRIAQAELDVQESIDDLSYFLQVARGTKFELEVPEGVPEYLVNLEVAIQQAAQSRKYKLTQQRQLTESERNIERSKKESGIDVDVSTNFGLSRSEATLPGAYGWPLEDQETVSIGVRIPLVDWGRAKIDQQIAASDYELLQQTIEQENVNFERTIRSKIRQLDIVRSQLKIAQKADEAAAKRYDISKKRYTVGKIDVTELNLALGEQTASRQRLMQALRSFWSTHYELRRLTLYDFEKGQVLGN